MEDEEKKPEDEAQGGPKAPVAGSPAPAGEDKPAEGGMSDEGSGKAKEMYDQLKKEGKSDDDILASLYIMYAQGQIKEEDLKALIGALGYEFSPEFAQMPDEQKKTAGIPGLDLGSEKPGDSADDKEPDGDADDKGMEKPGDKPDDKEPDGDGDDKNEEEKSEAFRLMGINKQ